MKKFIYDRCCDAFSKTSFVATRLILPAFERGHKTVSKNAKIMFVAIVVASKIDLEDYDLK